MSDELKEKYIDFQVVEEQVKLVTQQLQELNNKILELEYLRQSLDELKTVKKGSEILAPISPGIFVRAQIKDTEELLVNVGANSVVTKDVEDTKKLLNTQQGEIEKIRETMLSQLHRLSIKSQSLEKELRELTKDV